MSSILTPSSAVFTNAVRSYTYDLTTQEGLSNFWDFVLSIVPDTSYPGMVSTRWDEADKISVKLPDNDTILITSRGQIWLHGVIEQNIPFAWNSLSLCIIDPSDGEILTLRLDHRGIADIYLAYARHRRD